MMTAQTTRDRLIDTGLKLMHQNGYNATGVAEILKAADVPKGSFYHHFGSKEDFAAAALKKYTAREAEHAATVLSDLTVSPVKRLKRYFMDIVKFYGQQGAIPGCMMGTIATVIEQAVEQKELSADTDPESLAGFLLNSWEGALLRSQAEASDAPLEVFMHSVFDVMFKNLSRV
jgi:TetR/AcrR family transcriptional repressor of nem operon